MTGQYPHLSPEKHHGQDDQWNNQKHHAGQLETGGYQHGNGTDQHHEVSQSDGNRGPEDVLDLCRISRQTRQHFT